jgi:hypothetical protein
VAVSFIGGGNRSTRENPRPVASRLQTLSNNVVSSTPRHEPVQKQSLILEWRISKNMEFVTLYGIAQYKFPCFIMRKTMLSDRTSIAYE